MWEEVYYKEFDENNEGKEKCFLPYAVRCSDKDEFNRFIHYLNEKGFAFVEQIEGQMALLVNLELKRWCSWPKAAAMPCMNSKTYTVDEFKKLYYSIRKYPYTKEIIEHYRKDFYKALLEVKKKGKPYLSEEQAQHIVDCYSDGDLAYDMQFHTPEELAEINTM